MTDMLSNTRQRWICVAVGTFDHPVIGASNRRRGGYTKMEAWLWLIARAAYKCHPVGTQGKTIQLERGQLPVGQQYLAKEWGWGAQKVRTFLQQLCSENMVQITQPNRRSPNILTVCNYEKYQKSGERSNQQNNHLGNHQTTIKQPHSTKDKRKYKKKDIYKREDQNQTQLNMQGLSPEKGMPPSSICIVDAEVTEVVPPPAKAEPPPEPVPARLVPVDGSAAMAAALRPDLADAHESAFWTPDGRLHVFNGFRAELLDKLNGDEMRLRNRLDQVAPYCEKKEGLRLMLAIRRQFANHAESQQTPRSNGGAYRAARRAGLSMSDHYDDIFESEGDSK